MFFLTKQECETWVQALDIDTPQVESGRGDLRVNFVNQRHASLVLSQALVSWLGQFRECLLWVTEYGIWPSSEDWHLYYSLRTSYGDRRQIGAAPGHLFLRHEQTSLATFLSQALQFGWGGYLIGSPAWTYLFFSHDSWMSIVVSDSERQSILADVQRLSLPLDVHQR